MFLFIPVIAQLINKQKNISAIIEALSFYCYLIIKSLLCLQFMHSNGKTSKINTQKNGDDDEWSFFFRRFVVLFLRHFHIFIFIFLLFSFSTLFTFYGINYCVYGDDMRSSVFVHLSISTERKTEDKRTNNDNIYTEWETRKSRK